jgi:hypothetical protein
MTTQDQAKLQRRSVVARILADRDDTLVITGLGSPTYDVAAAGDHPNNFYLWGAMGSALTVGLGLAMAQPKRRVLVVTGDGELLMGLGALATAGVKQPENLAVAVIDNEHYGETGMQRTHTSAGVDLAGIARQAKFRDAVTVRDSAALVTLATETRVSNVEAPKLVNVIAKAYTGRSYTSTQEQAWLLLAARALSEEAKATSLSVGSASHTGELTRTFRPADLERSAIDIVNRGGNAVDTVISVEGASLTPEPAIARGFTIERTFYRLNGEKIDLASANGGRATLAQNERLVAVLTINGSDKGGRVLLVDRLPAGLEVENPRLVDSGDVKTLAWLKSGRSPKHTEFRDDRVVAAFDFFGDNSGGGNGASGEPVSASVAYVLRAVTPGIFVHPAATVEDMYRPERFARTASGTLEIGAVR